MMIVDKRGNVSESADLSSDRRTAEGIRSEEEEPRYRTGLPCVLVLAPALLLMRSGMSIPGKGMSAVGLIVLATTWGVLSSISLERSEFLVARKRMLIKTGFLRRRSLDLPLADIAGVYVYQPSLGKVLNFDKLTFKMKSGKRLSFRLVRHLLRLANVINEGRAVGRPL
jgi:hypothetical protein